MKKQTILSAAVALCFCAFVMFATKLQAQTPAEKLEHLSQVLNLSPQQKAQLLPILKAEAPKLESIKMNPSLSPKDKMKELMAIHKQTDPQVQTILSPQQYQQWQQIRQQEIHQAMQQR